MNFFVCKLFMIFFVINYFCWFKYSIFFLSLFFLGLVGLFILLLYYLIYCLFNFKD